MLKKASEDKSLSEMQWESLSAQVELFLFPEGKN